MLKAAALGAPGASSFPEPGRRGVCGGSTTYTLCSFSFASTCLRFSAVQQASPNQSESQSCMHSLDDDRLRLSRSLLRLGAGQEIVSADEANSSLLSAPQQAHLLQSTHGRA